MHNEVYLVVSSSIDSNREDTYTVGEVRQSRNECIEAATTKLLRGDCNAVWILCWKGRECTGCVYTARIANDNRRAFVPPYDMWKFLDAEAARIVEKIERELGWQSQSKGVRHVS